MKTALIASDHAGFDLKALFLSQPAGAFGDEALRFEDLGPTDKSSVDYPDYAKRLCVELLSGKASVGILICGSGQGMNIQANRFKGIRSALCWDLSSAKLAREHNNANILCLGSRLIPFGYALEIAKIFLQTPFLGGRHQNRLDKLD